jgi:hypothetical protein
MNTTKAILTASAVAVLVDCLVPRLRLTERLIRYVWIKLIKPWIDDDWSSHP